MPRSQTLQTCLDGAEAVTASRTICFHGGHFIIIYRVMLPMATVVISNNFRVIDLISIRVLTLHEMKIRAVNHY